MYTCIWTVQGQFFSAMDSKHAPNLCLDLQDLLFSKMYYILGKAIFIFLSFYHFAMMFKHRTGTLGYTTCHKQQRALPFSYYSGVSLLRG